MKKYHSIDVTHYPSLVAKEHVNLNKLTKKLLIAEITALKSEFKTLWLIHMELRQNNNDTERTDQTNLYRFLAG